MPEHGEQESVVPDCPGQGEESVQDAADRALWDALPVQEKERRRTLLRDIELRIAREGGHCARPHAERARQFMPFAALKGYDRLIDRQAAEHDATTQAAECGSVEDEMFCGQDLSDLCP